MLADDDKITILADDLTGAADACAPLVAICGPGRVCLSVSVGAQDRNLLSFDGNMRQLSDDLAGQTISVFAGWLAQHDRLGGLVWLKIDSATRGHIVRDTTLLLDALPAFRGAVVAPAFPGTGRLFQGGRAVFADGGDPAPSLREKFEAAGEFVITLSDLTGGTAAIGERIDAALSGAARIILVDTASQDDLVRLAPALLARRGDVLGVGSGGLIEAIAGGAGVTPRLTASEFTCLFGTQSQISRRQIDRFEESGGAIRVSRNPAQWRVPEGSKLSAEVIRVARTKANRIFDISGETETNPPERPSVSLARVVAPILPDLGTVMMSGGDTARAIFDHLGLNELDVVGVFEHGIPVCTAASLPNLLILKSGGFGDADTLLRLADLINLPENAI